MSAFSSQQQDLNPSSAAALSLSEDSLLSVAVSDLCGSVITPIQVLAAIWRKAFELLHEPKTISLAPGHGDNARMVRSYSGPRPHLVTRKRSGQYSCDNVCPNWRSLGVCAHSVAAAEDNRELQLFVKWFSKSKKIPNITKLATTEMPAGRGHKGGKAPPKKKMKTQTKSRVPFSAKLQCEVSGNSTTTSHVHEYPAISTSFGMPSSSQSKALSGNSYSMEAASDTVSR